jgi:hypothetical protein
VRARRAGRQRQSDKTGRQNSVSEQLCRAEPTGVKRVSILLTPVLVSSSAAPLISTNSTSWSSPPARHCSSYLLECCTTSILPLIQTQHSSTSCLNRSLPVSLSPAALLVPTFNNVPCPPGEARREFSLVVLAHGRQLRGVYREIILSLSRGQDLPNPVKIGVLVDRLNLQQHPTPLQEPNIFLTINIKDGHYGISIAYRKPDKGWATSCVPLSLPQGLRTGIDGNATKFDL